MFEEEAPASEGGRYNSKPEPGFRRRSRAPKRAQVVGTGSALARPASSAEMSFWAAIRSNTWLRRALAASRYFSGEYLPGDQIMATRRADSLRLNSLACLWTYSSAPDSIPKVSLPKYASFR